jgi:transposase
MNNREFRLSEAEARAIQGRESETKDVRELKRLQAVRLYGSGQAMKVVVSVVGSSRRTIQRWVAAYQEAGLVGLKARWQAANAQKLSGAQRAELVQRLQQYRPDQLLSAELRVSRGQFWTVSEVQMAVQTWYGVSYQASDSVRALLYEAGFSYQRTEGVYRSKPSPAEVAAFEEELEKKSSTSVKRIPTAGS